MNNQIGLFVVTSSLALAVSAMAQPVELTFRDSISNSLGESVVFDPFTATAFGNGANGIEYATINSNLEFGTLGAIDLNTYVTANIGSFIFGGVSSVDTDPLNRGFGVAAVINGAGAGSQGAAVFFNTASKTVIGHQLVGFHPDMVTFNPTGSSILVANESDNAVDLTGAFTGSISNINVSSVNGTLNFAGVTTTTTDFSAPFASGALVGIRDHGATMNRDNGLSSDTTPNVNNIEPEYISVSGDKAYVTLQEANAVGVFDIPTNTWSGFQKLGVNVQTMDAITRTSPGVISVTDTIATMATPDSIATFIVNGKTYYATANEGDYRDNNADRRQGSAFTVANGVVGAIDPALDAALDAQYGGNWQASTALGGTRFFNNVGDLDGDGDIDQLTIAGGRSMSIMDAATGVRLFDTNDNIAGFGGFEAWIAANDALGFNINQDATVIDSRSRDKGPEPESVAVGEYDGDLYALVGMERTNHLFLFRIVSDVGTATGFDPSGVEFVDAIRRAGEFGPETIDFVSGANSPSGIPFFIVGSEISNIWSVYSIPEPTTALLASIGSAFLLLGSRRRRKS